MRFLSQKTKQTKNKTNKTIPKGGSTVGGSVSSNGSFIESSSANVPSGSDEIAISIIGFDIDFLKFSDTIISKIVNYLNYIFEPVQPNFTIDVMSNHVQNLSILLFILTIIILIFFLSFLINMTLFVFSSRLLKYFTNKYILLSKLKQQNFRIGDPYFKLLNNLFIICSFNRITLHSESSCHLFQSWRWRSGYFFNLPAL